MGRHRGQAPEIDGSVFLSGAEVRPGELRHLQVTRATDYDLLGEVDDDPDEPVEMETKIVPGGASLVHRASDGRRVTLRTVP